MCCCAFLRFVADSKSPSTVNFKTSVSCRRINYLSLQVLSNEFEDIWSTPVQTCSDLCGFRSKAASNSILECAQMPVLQMGVRAIHKFVLDFLYRTLAMLDGYQTLHVCNLKSQIGLPQNPNSENQSDHNLNKNISISESLIHSKYRVL